MRRAFGQGKRGRRDIHLAVPHQNVAVASEAPEAPVLVHIRTVGIQEAAVTDHQVENGIPVAVRPFRIASENIEDLASVVLAARDLAVAVVIRFASGIGQPLDLVAFRVAHEPEVGVGVAAGLIVVLADAVETGLEPVLEVELLVLLTFAVDEAAIRMARTHSLKTVQTRLTGTPRRYCRGQKHSGSRWPPRSRGRCAPVETVPLPRWAEETAGGSAAPSR